MAAAKVIREKQKRTKGFSKIEPLLYQAAKNYKLEAAFYKNKVSKHWEQVLSEFLEEAEGKTQVIAFKNGILTIACLCKRLAYEIKVLSQRIAYALNNLLGGQFVFAIRIEV